MSHLKEENMNKQIRKFFPKGKSIDSYNQEQINLIAKTINETPLFHLMVIHLKKHLHFYLV